MERDDIKYLIKNYYRYQDQLKYLTEQIEKIEARATKITASYSQDPGRAPITNPKPSKVEKNAIKIADLKEKRDQVQRLIDSTDQLLSHLRPHQKYLLKCCISNGMKPEQFAKREGMKTETVKQNINTILSRLEKVDII